MSTVQPSDCVCRPAHELDICRHADSSEGCPVHEAASRLEVLVCDELEPHGRHRWMDDDRETMRCPGVAR